MTDLEYIAEQFAARMNLDARDFNVDCDDEIYTVSLMTDDEPECEWTFVCGSDDDQYTFTRDPRDNDDYPAVVHIPLMPE